MARPRSEDKPRALLDAATEAIARHGLGASTASIARLAGVAEGTLFHYFTSKDLLLQALFVHLLDTLREALAAGHGPQDPPEQRTRRTWDNYIDWGLAHPAAHSALNQLAASGKLPAELLEAASRLGADVGCPPVRLEFEDMSAAEADCYAEWVMNAIANATVSFAAANPMLAAASKRAGYRFLARAVHCKDPA